RQPRPCAGRPPPRETRNHTPAPSPNRPWQPFRCRPRPPSPPPRQLTFRTRPGMTTRALILSARGQARLPHGRDAGCCDRALDEAAAEHARLAFGRVVEHASLARRHAVLALEQIDLHAVRSPAQPGRLWRPRRAHLDGPLAPAGA